MEQGEKLPTFELNNQEDQSVSSQSWAGKPLVLFFYPKDDTPVCTIEACTFRDQFSDFKDISAQVVGISVDSVASHKNFHTKHQLNYPILSDSNKEVEKLFGLERSLFGLLAKRVTFVFDSSGTLVKRIDSRLNGKKHVAEAIKALN
ncbi:MAG: peroxiredoxin [Reichenbachiella sp.]